MIDSQHLASSTFVIVVLQLGGLLKRKKISHTYSADVYKNQPDAVRLEPFKDDLPPTKKDNSLLMPKCTYE